MATSTQMRATSQGFKSTQTSSELIYNSVMLFSKSNDEKTLVKLRDISTMTVIKYVYDSLNTHGTPDKMELKQLTLGQMLCLLFGENVDADGSQMPDAVKDAFNTNVLPSLPRLANEAVHQDTDLAYLSFNYLEIKAGYLAKKLGSEWQETDEGINVSKTLTTVYGHRDINPITMDEYIQIVSTLQDKYSNEPSTVDWNYILDIDNYT